MCEFSICCVTQSCIYKFPFTLPPLNPIKVFKYPWSNINSQGFSSSNQLMLSISTLCLLMFRTAKYLSLTKLHPGFSFACRVKPQIVWHLAAKFTKVRAYSFKSDNQSQGYQHVGNTYQSTEKAEDNVGILGRFYRESLMNQNACADPVVSYQQSKIDTQLSEEYLEEEATEELQDEKIQEWRNTSNICLDSANTAKKMGEIFKQMSLLELKVHYEMQKPKSSTDLLVDLSVLEAFRKQKVTEWHDCETLNTRAHLHATEEQENIENMCPEEFLDANYEEIQSHIRMVEKYRRELMEDKYEAFDCDPNNRENILLRLNNPVYVRRIHDNMSTIKQECDMLDDQNIEGSVYLDDDIIEFTSDAETFESLTEKFSIHYFTNGYIGLVRGDTTE